MKRTLTLILLSASVLQSISAQDRAVRIKAERKENKAIELVSEVKGPGTYTAMASFDNLENASQPEVIIKTGKYGANFHTLYPLSKYSPIGSTTLWSGYINRA